jgi:hypothetical protein
LPEALQQAANRPCRRAYAFRIEGDAAAKAELGKNK